MMEILNNLWEACKSGDVQAVLAVCFAVISATSPVWIKLINVGVNKWRYRYDAVKEAAKLNFNKATDLANESKEIFSKLDDFMAQGNESVKNLAELLTYIIDNSTLTDAQKAYAKETYISKITTAKPVEEIKPNEEVKPLEPEQPTKEKEEPTETPVGI